MKKYFEFHDEKSHKFWAIEQNDNSFIVTFGKIGTEGKSSIKYFTNRDETAIEIEKIIKEKIENGYLEIHLIGVSQKIDVTKLELTVEERDIKTVANELREFARILKKRPDIKVTICKIGKKAGEKAIAFTNKLNKQLAYFYAEMNGIHIEWEFIEEGGGGKLQIFPFDNKEGFLKEDHHCMGFCEEDELEAMLFDMHLDDNNTWFVRAITGENDPESHIVFACAAEGRNGRDFGENITDYIRQGIESGFVYNWPLPDSYSTDYIHRFLAEPKKPNKFINGMRVTDSSYGKGTFIRMYEGYYGDTGAHIQIDEGSTVWVSKRQLKIRKEEDYYDRLQEPSYDFMSEGLDQGLLNLARVLGPSGNYYIRKHTILPLPQNATIAAGLLARREISQSIDELIKLYDACLIANTNFLMNICIGKDKLSFNGGQYCTYAKALFEGLFYGLALLVHQYSIKNKLFGDQIVRPELVEKLKDIELAGYLVEVLTANFILSTFWDTELGYETANDGIFVIN